VVPAQQMGLGFGCLKVCLVSVPPLPDPSCPHRSHQVQSQTSGALIQDIAFHLSASCNTGVIHFTDGETEAGRVLWVF
jgi:hypothetical protein